MNRSASPLKVFRRTGDRSGIETGAEIRNALRPALFGVYQDLSRLRFDFPLVFNTLRGSEPWVMSLADVFDQVIRETCPPGAAGEQPRRQLLAQEQAIRDLLEQGKKGTLGRLWKLAHRELDGYRKKPLKQLLQQAQSLLPLDGEVCQCDRDLAMKLIGRAWEESETRKARVLSARISRLAQKLREILEVDDRRSARAFAAERLESAVGSADRNVFDFAIMSTLLGNVPKGYRLPARRRQRIEATIEILESQRFAAGGNAEGGVFDFRFSSCRAALAAYRERLPPMAALVRAIAIAELEVNNHYDEALHDRFFEDIDPDMLGPADLGLFPSYLLCLDQHSADFKPEVFRLLGAGLPFKVIVQFREILGEEGVADGGLAFGTRAQQPARMAIGLAHAFVLQASNSSLYRLRETVVRGVAGDQPALFCIYAGRDYLDGAAATESRVFPCLAYDPSAGPDQAHRFGVAGNPAPAQDWVRHVLCCEGPDREPLSLDTSFSPVDFVAADERFRAHFATVSEDDWDDDMLPCAEFLELEPQPRANRVPYVLLLDGDNRLLRAVVDDKLIDAALRCRDAWRNLRELAGIENSHAIAAVEEARQAWQAERADSIERQVAAAEADTTPPEDIAGAVAPTPPEPAASPEEPSAASDDPWIETLRCTTCNECTLINERMFAYDDDMRAYVADPDAGTYRELVEAAESCQVAIIHPGKPRNPDEPGLEELVERARPFL